MRSILDWIFISERIKDDVYAAGRPAHYIFSLSARYESLASGIQLENTFKHIF